MQEEKLLPQSVETKPLPPPHHPAPKRLHWWYLLAAMIVVVALLLFAGYLPRQRRNSAIAEAASLERDRLPIVHVTRVERAPRNLNLLLPGNITPLTETVLYARAAGYIAKRYADIGDHARSGQVLAGIDTPELDQQVAQARASLDQAHQQVTQSRADLESYRTQAELARITFERYRSLVGKGAISRQDYDQQNTAFEAAAARVRSGEANVGAAQQNARSAQANLARLTALQDFKLVRAPFDGIVTARNFDVGALVGGSGAANGELYRMAQVNRLRIFISVPQANAPDIHVGEAAAVTVAEFPGQTFSGRITRSALALDSSARTLLTEVQVENPRGILLPGMYAQVLLSNQRSAPPLLVPGDSLIADSRGLHVAVVTEDPAKAPTQRLHLAAVQVGRDYGPRIEILSGLTGSEFAVLNPGDDVDEGVEVRVRAAAGARSR